MTVALMGLIIISLVVNVGLYDRYLLYSSCTLLLCARLHGWCRLEELRYVVE